MTKDLQERVRHQHTQDGRVHQGLCDLGFRARELVETHRGFEPGEQEFDLPVQPIRVGDLGRRERIRVEVREIEVVLAGLVVAHNDQTHAHPRDATSAAILPELDRNFDLVAAFLTRVPAETDSAGAS